MSESKTTTLNYFEESQNPAHQEFEWLCKIPDFHLTIRSSFEPLIDPEQLHELQQNGEDPEEILHTSFLDYWKNKSYYSLLKQELLDIVIIVTPLALLLSFASPNPFIFFGILIGIILFGSLPVIAYRWSQYSKNPEHVLCKYLERSLVFQIRRLAGFPHNQVTIYESLMGFFGRAALHYSFLIIMMIFSLSLQLVFKIYTPLVYILLMIILYFLWPLVVPGMPKIKAKYRINELLAQHLLLSQLYIKKEIQSKPRWYLGHRKYLASLFTEWGISPKVIQALLPGVELQPEIILAEPKVDLL
ncbi:MAG: hypothetical protein SFY68_02175 [Candidatus Sumerlaeia bacterium]|nr:hypothetical protein [Candidatus Sumerlaeia bacterium]